MELPAQGSLSPATRRCDGVSDCRGNARLRGGLKRVGCDMLSRIALTVLVALFGAAGAVQAAEPSQMHVPVLMYHNIECATSTTRLRGLFVCPDALDAQMALLEQNGWHTITADELAADVTSGTCPGPKTFVVTVDDGALNGYTNGAPVWESHGFRATFAMVTGKAGDYLLDPPPTWYNAAKPHFSWDQARDLIARGHGVANHTVMHTAVANDTTTQLDAEVQAAQDQIARELGFTPKLFVYPYGLLGTTETPYLAARFVLAFTDPGNGAPAGADETTDPMHAPRLRVSRSTTPTGLLSKMHPYRQPC